MENEVVREDGDGTERRSWSAAEAAAYPALGIHPIAAEATAPLSRVPRSSAAPPSSETVITPAPKFDDEGLPAEASLLAEDDALDGIVELSSTMLVDEHEAPEHELELLADDLVEEVDELSADQLLDEAIELQDAEVLEEHDVIEDHDLIENHDLIEDHDVIEEVDSELLAFVETRGEITDTPRKKRSSSDISSVSLVALHETLHNQAVESGMAMYSTGVPSHALDHSPESGKTLKLRRTAQIHSAKAPAATAGWFTTRNLLVGTVFLAGIGAGVFFGMPSKSGGAAPDVSVTAPAPLAAAAAIASTEAPAQEPVSDIQTLVEPPVPVVEPLDVTAAEFVATEVVEPSVAETEAIVPEVVELDVRPLEVTPLEIESAPEPVKTVTPKQDDLRTAKRARTRSAAAIPAESPSAIGTGDPGVLMLGAKPPCEIRIDGKKTGLTTPQRVLRLPAGKHKITLVNREHKIRDSFKVSIKSGQKTRIVRDNTSKIK